MQENGEVVDENETTPEVEEINRKLIEISGHKDKCQQAKEALEVKKCEKFVDLIEEF